MKCGIKYVNNDKIGLFPCLHSLHLNCALGCLKNKKDCCPVCEEKVSGINNENLHKLNSRSRIEVYLMTARIGKRDGESLSHLIRWWWVQFKYNMETGYQRNFSLIHLEMFLQQHINDIDTIPAPSVLPEFQIFYPEINYFEEQSIWEIYIRPPIVRVKRRKKHKNRELQDSQRSI